MSIPCSIFLDRMVDLLLQRVDKATGHGSTDKLKRIVASLRFADTMVVPSLPLTLAWLSKWILEITNNL